MARSNKTWYTVVKADKVLLRAQGRTEADGTIRLLNGTKWMPLVLKTECEARKLDPSTVQKTCVPVECLGRMGRNGSIEVLTDTEWDARQTAATAAADAALEVAVPGLTELTKLSERVADDVDRHHRAFERMMEDEGNDGARPPKGVDKTAADRLKTLRSAYPRSALYLRAKRETESHHWSDPTGAAGAGRKAMEILAASGSIEDATAALAVRREIDPGM